MHYTAAFVSSRPAKGFSGTVQISLPSPDRVQINSVPLKVNGLADVLRLINIVLKIPPPPKKIQSQSGGRGQTHFLGHKLQAPE